MTIDSKTRQKSSLTQIRTGMLWFAVIGTFLIGIRCLECLGTCTRGGGLTLKIAKPRGQKVLLSSNFSKRYDERTQKLLNLLSDCRFPGRTPGKSTITSSTF